jgi:hypothetical protein
MAARTKPNPEPGARTNQRLDVSAVSTPIDGYDDEYLLAVADHLGWLYAPLRRTVRGWFSGNASRPKAPRALTQGSWCRPSDEFDGLHQRSAERGAEGRCKADCTFYTGATGSERAVRSVLVHFCPGAGGSCVDLHATRHERGLPVLGRQDRRWGSPGRGCRWRAGPGLPRHNSGPVVPALAIPRPGREARRVRWAPAVGVAVLLARACGAVRCARRIVRS